MKITYIFRNPEKGGKSIEELFLNISKEIEKKHHVNIFIYDKTKNIYQNLINIYSLKSDIYHITGDIYFVAPFLLLKKTVLTIHDIGHYKNLKGLKKWIYSWIWLKIPARFANKITVVSDYSKADLLKHLNLPRKKLIVIPNPKPSIFQETSYPKNETPIILQVGTGENKNLPTVIKAIKGLPVELWIIGKLKNDISLSLRKNEIKFKNFYNLKYEEVLQKYQSANLVTFVSTHEGFGMPILEANAIGRPIIISKVCSLPMVAKDAAVYISDPMDDITLRKKIVELINNSELRKRIINKGFENVKRFELNKIAQTYIKCYKNCLS